jgi:hypothetical protein
MLMVKLLELSLKLSIGLAMTFGCENFFVKYPRYKLLLTSAFNALFWMWRSMGLNIADHQ